MELIFKTKEFKRLKDKSSYNDNYYEYIGNSGAKLIIREECDECYNTYTFTDVTNKDNEFYLGCSQNGFSDKEVLIIDFIIPCT